MDPAAATGQVRVAIIGEDAAVDLALPTTLAIRGTDSADPRNTGHGSR